MKFKVKEQDGQTVVFLDGMLDTTSAPEFKELIDKLLEKDYLDLRMDLTGMNYISSVGIRAILTLIKKMVQRNQKLVFCGIAPAVKGIFDLSGLTEIITIL